MQQHYHLFETAIGPCAVAWNDAGLTRVRLPGRSSEATIAGLNAAACTAAETLPAFVASCVRDMQAYFDGEAVDFRVTRLDWSRVPAFNAKLYRALAEVPHGRTTTYGALAKTIGEPIGAARAVGVAMGRNPWPIVIPCHRVLASGDQLGGFSAPGGVDTKKRLLRLEGSLREDDAPFLPGLFTE